MKAKHILILRAVIFFAFAIATFCLGHDKMLSAFLGAVFLVISYFSFRGIKEAGHRPLYQPRVYAATNKDLKGAIATLIIICIIFPSLTIWTIYDLNQLESHTVESATLWLPIAILYKVFGYWISASILPVLTGVLLIAGIRKIVSVKKDIAFTQFHNNIGVTDPAE